MSCNQKNPNFISINPENNNFMNGSLVFPMSNNQNINYSPRHPIQYQFIEVNLINPQMNQTLNINMLYNNSMNNNLPIDNNNMKNNLPGNNNMQNYNNNTMNFNNMQNNQQIHYNVNIHNLMNNNDGINKQVYKNMEKPKMECSLNNDNNKKTNLFKTVTKKESNIQNIPISENYNQIKSQNSQTNDIVMELENSDTDKTNEIQENTLNPIDLFTSQQEEKKNKINKIIDNFQTDDEELLKILFNSIVDENNPNIITFNSYKKNLQKIGETQSDEEIEEMLLLASQNGKLELTFEEYRDAIKKNI